MAATPRRNPPPDPSHFRHSYAKDTAQLDAPLVPMEGQVRGIARMIEREEYCVDILQQTAALRAAVDALSILILEDHVQGCVRTAAERGEADQYVDEVVDVVRRRSVVPCPERGPDVPRRPVLSARATRPRGVARTHRAPTMRGYDGADPARADPRAVAVPRTRRSPCRARSTTDDGSRVEPRTAWPTRNGRLLAVTLDILALRSRLSRLAGVLTCSLASSVPSERPSWPTVRTVAVAASGPDDARPRSTSRPGSTLRHRVSVPAARRGRRRCPRRGTNGSSPAG